MFKLSVNKDLFRLGEIPKMHPATREYLEYWKEQKKRCVEGHWVSGTWMPGVLYFYCNFATIKGNKQGSKTKSFMQPFLRDLEWEFFYNWTETRGFSGFQNDEEYTCHRDCDPHASYVQSDDFLKRMGYSVFKKDGTKKEYIPAREYLRKTWPSSMGRPLFDNQSKNMLMLGSRGFGKSYSASCLIAHEFLMDGMTHHTLDNIKTSTSSITVGAGDAKYSTDLISKAKVIIEKLPGGVTIGKKYYPSPLSKLYSGSWTPSKSIRAEYEMKVGGTWETLGSKSIISHITYKDNPFAANGKRSSVMLYEEIGFFPNLIQSHIASVECMMNGSDKYGSALYLGTGGDMEGGGTLDAASMFYNPDVYNLIKFQDIYENKGDICYFVPAYLGLNDYKDDNGNTHIQEAKDYLENYRKRLREGDGAQALDGELQNRPLVPSEAFLSSSGNIFPVAELRDVLTRLEQNDRLKSTDLNVELAFDATAPRGVSYKVDLENKLRPINKFPWDQKTKEGCVTLFELPVEDDEGNVPDGMYLIGHDPFASDDPTGGSFASIYVLKTKKYMFEHGHDEIVAEYVGRPYMGRKAVNEILLKLSKLYNAKIYFENVRGNVKEYFEKVKELRRLAKQPRTVLSKRASYETNPNQQYGYPMSSRQMKMEGIQYLRDWLLEERGKRETEEGETVLYRNYDLIRSKALLLELINFNLDGNFDRVMGMVGCVVGLEETYNQYQNIIDNPNSNEHELQFLTSNKHLFTSTIAKESGLFSWAD